MNYWVLVKMSFFYYNKIIHIKKAFKLNIYLNFISFYKNILNFFYSHHGKGKN
jgi:hypothetical protein